MTAPSPSPASPREPRAKPMPAFYLSTGFVAFLFAGSYLAWTPLRIWHHGRQYKETQSAEQLHTAAGLLLKRRATTAEVVRSLGEPRDRYPVRDMLDGEVLIYESDKGPGHKMMVFKAGKLSVVRPIYLQL